MKTPETSLSAKFIINTCNRNGLGVSRLKIIAEEMGLNTKLSHNSLEDLERLHDALREKFGIVKRG